MLSEPYLGIDHQSFNWRDRLVNQQTVGLLNVPGAPATEQLHKMGELMDIYSRQNITLDSYLPHATDRAAPDPNRAKRSSPYSTTYYQQRNATYAGRPYTPNELLSGFSQKWGTMNCVTVAGIKAAMQRFGGPNQVYASVEQTREGFNIKMRDNPSKTYQVTYAELDYAAQRSGFRGTNQKMLNEANFMYAVSAKRAQMENNDGYASHSFSAALDSINSWENTQEGLDRLGLRNYVRPAYAQDLINGVPGVMAQNDHVFTVLNGLTDNYGTSGYRPDPWASAIMLVQEPYTA